jgi:hypothetical protein
MPKIGQRVTGHTGCRINYVATVRLRQLLALLLAIFVFLPSSLVQLWFILTLKIISPTFGSIERLVRLAVTVKFQPNEDTIGKLRQNFFPLARAEKRGEKAKKVKRSKAKKFRVSSKKVQILKSYSIGQVLPARSYYTRSFISEMWDVLRRHFNHICRLVMSRATWVSALGSEKVEK